MPDQAWSVSESAFTSFTIGVDWGVLTMPFQTYRVPRFWPLLEISLASSSSVKRRRRVAGAQSQSLRSRATWASKLLSEPLSWRANIRSFLRSSNSGLERRALVLNAGGAATGAGAAGLGAGGGGACVAAAWA